MQCPRCSQKIALHINQCPKCNQKLKPLILSQQRPLSQQHHQSLLSEIIPLSIALGLLVGMCMIFYFALKVVAGLIWPIVGLMLVVVGFYWLSRVRDLLSGHEQVLIDQLLELRYVRTRRKTRLYGDFKLLGSKELKMEHGDFAIEGKYYIVTYSPHSKVVWELVLVARKRA